MRCTAVFNVATFVVSLVVSTDIAFAQFEDGGSSAIPKPRSDIGGYTGQELRRIYRQDIGRGYTGSDQNSIALSRSRSFVPYVGQATTASGPNSEVFASNNQRLDLGLSSASPQKPFANVQSRPAVSPYMNLFREDLEGGSDLNYQTLVKPQLEQQRFNQRFQDEAQALSRRVQQISAQPAYSPKGSQTQYPTGHQTVFGYYGRFYPSMSSGRR